MTRTEPTDVAAEEISPDRTVFLTDGVIAIAMTLLALDLKPDLPIGASSRELGHFLREHGTQYASFAIAFAVIAQYWVTHHRIMSSVRRASNGLMAANLLFLFGVTLVPLTTYMQGNYTGSLSVTLFAANVLLISLCLAGIRTIVARGSLNDSSETAAAHRARIVRAVVVVGVPALVAGLAWVLGGQASWFFLLFFLSDDVVTRRRPPGWPRLASPG